MKKINYEKCKNINDVAKETILGQSSVYDFYFPEYLRRMPHYLEYCKSYRELGTNQGGSASIALGSNLNYYELIDKSFNNFRPIKHLFDEYSLTHNIDIVYHEESSLEVITHTETDFLLIDSVHKYSHVTKELDLYAPLTKKYIMFHDTAGIPQVYNAVLDFLKNNNQWTEIEVFKKSAGYVIIERTDIER
jgi:hypothetical protein